MHPIQEERPLPHHVGHVCSSIYLPLLTQSFPNSQIQCKRHLVRVCGGGVCSICSLVKSNEFPNVEDKQKWENIEFKLKESSCIYCFKSTKGQCRMGKTGKKTPGCYFTSVQPLFRTEDNI